ncbi:hypothetical protein [Bradyrhizobium erythrophlei]|uniref:Uncharacterized protein n=1 Tax=Bradyrhizobium erythrophlei TaxID=1437360 RepID=A0A1H4NGE1_9BRAD|nr:hypothetical protein [Bradyrhizobium erythrophlei]SEB93642.1 hypothetical protein SAMN05444164_0608 [Bradyrhizobium erythrophlei]
MDRDQDIDGGLGSALRRSYGRFAWWIVRLNRVLEPSRAAEPPRTQLPPRAAVPPRRSIPPRPE